MYFLLSVFIVMKNKWISSIMWWVIVTIFRLWIGIGGWYALSSYRLEQRANREYQKLEARLAQIGLEWGEASASEVKREIEVFLGKYGEVLPQKKQELNSFVALFERSNQLFGEMKSLDFDRLDSSLFYSRVAVEWKISSVKKVLAWKENFDWFLSELIEKVNAGSGNYTSEHLERFENAKLYFDELEKQKKLELEIYQFVLDKQGQFEVKNGQVIWYKQRDLNHIKKLVKDLEEQESRLEKIGEEVKKKEKILQQRERGRLKKIAERE